MAFTKFFYMKSPIEKIYSRCIAIPKIAKIEVYQWNLLYVLHQSVKDIFMLKKKTPIDEVLENSEQNSRQYVAFIPFLSKTFIYTAWKNVKSFSLITVLFYINFNTLIQLLTPLQSTNKE